MPSTEGEEREIAHPGPVRDPESVPGPGSEPTGSAFALLAIVALALALRLHGIGEQGVWIDEANSILTAGHPLTELVQRLRLDSSPPFFYGLLHYWMALVGDGGVSLRLLSAILGAGLVAATGWSGRQLSTRSVGLMAALFVAVSPVQVHYSQQVRMYALLPLLAVVATTFLARYLQHGRRRDFASWLVASVLALYTHNFAIHLLFVHGAMILASGSALQRPGRWLLALAIGAAAYAPWLPIALGQLENGDHYAWFVPHWDLWGTAGVVQRSLLSWSPGGEYLILAGLRDLSEIWRGVPALFVTVLAGVGAWSQLRAWRSAREAAAGSVAPWPVLLVAIPIVSALVVSVASTPHYVPSRVDQMMLPGFALLVASGIDVLRAAYLRTALLVAIVAIGVASSLLLRPDHGTRGYVLEGGVERSFEVAGSESALAQRIADRWQPGDVVVFTSLTRAPVEYYLRRAAVDGPFLSFPADTAEHLGSQNDARWLAEPALLRREAARIVQQARERAGEQGCVFLVRGLAQINGFVGPRAMTRFGFREVESLGHFQQTGVNAVAELLVYRAGEGS